MTILLYANGRRVASEPFGHPHGQDGDLFLRIDPQEVLNPGDRIEWSGVLPEGKTQLWVRYTRIHPVDGSSPMIGNARLKDSDRRKEP